MGGYLTFEARIEPMIWGDKTYTILRLPDDILADLGDCARVEGEIAEHPVNLAVTRGGSVPGAYLWTGRSLLDRAGLSPGDLVEVRLRPAPANAVETPDDLAAALRAASLSDAWDALSPGKRRGALHQIDTAKRAETRHKRIAALLATLEAP